MKFNIVKNKDNTASLMTQEGNLLAYFTSVQTALIACEEWYICNKNEIKQEINIHYESTSYLKSLDLESQWISEVLT